MILFDSGDSVEGRFTVEEIVSAFYDLFGNEPATDNGLRQYTAAEFWRTLPEDVQQDITACLTGEAA